MTHLGKIFNIAFSYMFKDPLKRALPIVAYAYMFKEPFKRALTNIAYHYMFKEQFKRALTIIRYLHMFKDRTYHLAMMKVDIRRFNAGR